MLLRQPIKYLFKSHRGAPSYAQRSHGEERAGGEHGGSPAPGVGEVTGSERGEARGEHRGRHDQLLPEVGQRELRPQQQHRAGDDASVVPLH